MTVRPVHWALALVFSAGVHLAAVIVFLDQSEDAAFEAGGAALTVSILGDSMEDMLAAGELSPSTSAQSETLEPINPLDGMEELTQAPPATMEPFAPSDPTEVRPVTSQTAVEPVDIGSADARPSEPLSAEPRAEREEISANAPNAIQSSRPDLMTGSSSAAATDSSNAIATLDPVETVQEIAGTEPFAAPIPSARPPDLVPPRPTQQSRPARQSQASVQQSSARQSANTARPRQQARAEPAGESGQARRSAQRGGQQTANAAATTRAGQRAVVNYPGQVARKLRRSLRYPRDARRQGITGQAQVRFTVRANGQATSIRLVGSSGSSLLDAAAVDTVRRASPFRPIPPEAGRSSWTFTVPLAFGR